MKPFSLKSTNFGPGQTNWADEYWGIWGIFCKTKYQHSFYYSESLVHYYKKLSLYIHIPNICLGLRFEFEFGLKRIWDLTFVCPQSVVRSVHQKMAIFFDPNSFIRQFLTLDLTQIILGPTVFWNTDLQTHVLFFSKFYQNALKVKNKIFQFSAFSTFQQ